MDIIHDDDDDDDDDDGNDDDDDDDDNDDDDDDNDHHLSPVRADSRCRRCVDMIIMMTAGDAEDAS